jgi:hypothetical protein
LCLLFGEDINQIFKRNPHSRIVKLFANGAFLDNFNGFFNGVNLMNAKLDGIFFESIFRYFFDLSLAWKVPIDRFNSISNGSPRKSKSVSLQHQNINLIHLQS